MHSTVAVAIDLSHAFNTVKHEILITEISKFELNGHIKRFLSGYLRGGQTYVLFCDQKSNYMKMKQGVPLDTPSFIRIIPTVYDSDRSPDCGQSPHTTTHIFNCPAKLTTILDNPIDMAIHLGLAKRMIQYMKDYNNNRLIHFIYSIRENLPEGKKLLLSVPVKIKNESF